MRTLKPGGLAVHTTEFNFLDEEHTIDNWPTVLYQRAHFERLAEALRADGHRVAPLDFDKDRSRSTASSTCRLTNTTGRRRCGPISAARAGT